MKSLAGKQIRSAALRSLRLNLWLESSRMTITKHNQFSHWKSNSLMLICPIWKNCHWLNVDEFWHNHCIHRHWPQNWIILPQNTGSLKWMLIHGWIPIRCSRGHRQITSWELRNSRWQMLSNNQMIFKSWTDKTIDIFPIVKVKVCKNLKKFSPKSKKDRPKVVTTF